MSIVCIVASAFSWDAALHPWRKQGLKSTIAKITFQASLGFVIMFQALVIRDQSGMTNFLFALGSLIIVFSLPSLTLTAATSTD